MTFKEIIAPAAADGPELQSYDSAYEHSLERLLDVLRAANEADQLGEEGERWLSRGDAA